MWVCLPIVAVSGAHAYGGKAGSQAALRTLAPSDILPTRSRQLGRQLFHGDGFTLAVPAQQFRRTSLARPRFRGQRLGAWFPNRHGGLHPDCIEESERGDARAKLRVVSISRVSQHRPARYLYFHRLPNLVQSNLGFRLKRNLFRHPGFLPPLGILVSFFFFQAEDGIRDYKVTGVQTCALPICNDTVKAASTGQGRCTDLVLG